ncbi:hypothetical protein [Borrelia sp. RT5S]|uniref:hypothetical protein n=1 Tax=Borrelia sp. RT5S TaxID=2898581 RepID=UPI001E47341B|nr:hypothetical protein [Borrelia sp. RT5S]UGQ16012.1 hypothetical protein LSO06_01645 [Borrelia sp. RT5S]
MKVLLRNKGVGYLRRSRLVLGSKCCSITKDVFMLKKSKLILISSLLTFSLVSCETTPEERKCDDYKILKPSGNKKHSIGAAPLAVV